MPRVSATRPAQRPTDTTTLSTSVVRTAMDVIRSHQKRKDGPRACAEVGIQCQRDLRPCTGAIGGSSTAFSVFYLHVLRFATFQRRGTRKANILKYIVNHMFAPGVSHKILTPIVQRWNTAECRNLLQATLTPAPCPCRRRALRRAVCPDRSLA